MDNVKYIKPGHYKQFANDVDRTFQDRKKALPEKQKCFPFFCPVTKESNVVIP